MPQGRGKITWRARHCIAGPWARGEESTRGRGSGWSVPVSPHRAPEATKNPGYFAGLSQEALEGPPFPRDLLKTKFTPQDSPRGNFHFGKIWVFFLSCLLCDSPHPLSPLFSCHPANHFLWLLLQASSCMSQNPQDLKRGRKGKHTAVRTRFIIYNAQL